MLNVSKGVTRLALQLGSVDLARRWLANWNLAFLERRASCRPLTVSPLTQGQGTLDYLSTPPVSQPQVTGSPRAAAGRSPGSVLPTFEEATGSTGQQTSSATVVSSGQDTFADSQPLSASNLSSASTMAGAPLSNLSTVTAASRGEAGLALHDHRALVTSFPSIASELTTVSGRTEEVETTQIPVEPPSVNPSSQGFALPGINSGSFSLTTPNQMGQAASSSVSQTSFTTPFSVGSLLRPPPLLLNSGFAGLGPRFPMATQPFPPFTGAQGGFVPPVFPTLPANPQVSSMGPGGAFPLLATGSVRPVFTLPGLEPRSSVANPPPPSTVTSAQPPVVPGSDVSFTVEVEEEMDASCSLLQSTFSEASASQLGSTTDPSTLPDFQSYDHILSVVLKDLGKSELLVRDLPKPRSFWELDQEVQVKTGAGALNIDSDMVAELTKAFKEPSTTSKVTDSASAYKVPAELYTALFKTPKVEEEMVKQVGNIRPLAINPDFRRALEASYESSMATWRLGWHMTVMINFLYNHCQDDPVLKAVCNHLHGAIRESRLTSAQAASVAIAAQRRMILDASAFRDCRPLRATLFATPYVGTSLFGGQFQSSVEEATRSQEKLTQVRRLASSGSRAAQGTSGPRAPVQSQKRRAAPPPPPPTAQAVPSGDGGSAAKRRRSKNRGANRRSGGAPAQPQAQQGARGQGVSNKRPQAGRR